MSEPIKTGDTVMLVRGHSCCIQEAGGVPMTVSSVGMAASQWCCPVCSNPNIHPKAHAAAVKNGAYNFPVAWLKRIDPLTEPESTEHREEISA